MTKTKNLKQNNLITRPPIVVVLGHVDHGKTSLLDSIRKTNIVSQESGGITQHIGAYQIKHNDKLITFIDTPGHEAFCQMRSRGVKVADIAILVVAGEEGVKPQTKEVIECIKKEEIPVIVALNKMDKPQANPEKVFGELEKEGLIVEQRGGKVPAVKLSALTGIGTDDLLEMILLMAEMEELKADIKKPASGVVVESYLDQKRGTVATLLVLEGELEKGQWVSCGNSYGKVKNLENFQENQIDKATPSMPVIILGLNQVPVVGDKFSVVLSEDEAKSLAMETAKKRIMPIAKKTDQSKNEKLLNIILKTDVHGSLEAILESLSKIDLADIKLNILKTEVGEISEADVKSASPSNAVIIGFRVKAPANIFDMAKRNKVKIRSYEIIYELFEDIKKEASKLLEPEISRENLGKLKVIAIFRKEKSRMIIGGKVLEGRAVNKVPVDVMRNDEKIGHGKIVQLQQNKKDVGEVEKGREAGLLIEGEPIIEEGDILNFYREEKIKREL